MSSIKENKTFSFSLSKVWIPFAFLVCIWLIKWMEMRLDLDFSHLGVYPKHLKGLAGVVSGPMIHGDLNHLLHNSLPFVALSLAIIYFYGKLSNRVFFISYLGTGILVWMFGRESFHIGASGVVYALASFVFFSGIIRQHAQLIAISLLVVFLYGGMVWGLFPVEPKISWESHLSGAIMGLIIAVLYRKVGPQKRRFEWEDEEEDFTDEAYNWPQASEVNYIYKPKEKNEEES